MGINEIYQRSYTTSLMMQQFGANQAAVSAGVNSPAGAGNAALVPGISSYAIAGEVGATAPEETFNINNVDKVVRTNKSEEISRLGSVKSQYFEPVLDFQNFSFRTLTQPHNPSLSFMRGIPGFNLPLNQDAIYTNGGILAANLNLIC